MKSLGLLEEWVGATAEGTAAVRFSSCFPMAGETLFVAPPQTVWPPGAGARVRWKAARFVPVGALRSLLDGNEPADDRWRVDAASGCLLPMERNAPAAPPFRVAERAAAPVDRVTGASAEAHTTACLEFAEGAGLWCLAVFADEAERSVWGERVCAAFRLLGDSGVGGERSRGWGRFELGGCEDARFPEILGVEEANGEVAGWWMLSLFSPGADDAVDWQRGHYSLTERSGRIESAAGWGVPKLTSRMVEEGSVVFARSMPRGGVQNVAPEGFPHPVYRAGLAVAVPLRTRSET